MKFTLLTFLFVSILLNGYGQLEITTGYAVNKNLADGLPIQLAYDMKIKNRLFTKSQVGYKALQHFNDYVGATLKVKILEFHQTISYEVIKKEKYILKPNIGLNYRIYQWKGEMDAPYNTLPQRVYKIEFRDDRLRLSNFDPVTITDGDFTDQYDVSNIGFTIQLQSQFRMNENTWFHVTPFLEPDYDKSQNTGGCYIGIILKQL